MVASKLLLVVILAVIVLAIWLLFFTGLNSRAYETVDESVDNLFQVGKCSVGLEGQLIGAECDQNQERSICLQNPKCSWCSGTINSQRVSTCGIAVCGCPFGLEPGVTGILFTLEDSFLKPGDKLQLTGEVEEEDFGTPEVTVLITDQYRNPVPSMGVEEIIEADDEGIYRWEYDIPEDVAIGQYNVIMKYSGAIDSLRFNVFPLTVNYVPITVPTDESETTSGGTDDGTETSTPDDTSDTETPATPTDSGDETSIPTSGGTEIPERTFSEDGSFTLKVFMMQYGNYMSESSIKSFIKSYEDEIVQDSAGLLSVDTTFVGSFDLVEKPQGDYNKIISENKHLRQENAERIWYLVHDDINTEILLADIDAGLLEKGFDKNKYDVAIVITEGQIHGKGNVIGEHIPRSGEIPFTILLPQPIEKGYIEQSTHVVATQRENQLVDVIIHELGHHMRIGHNCDGIRCNECKSVDIMSYCVNNGLYDEDDPIDRFSSCSLGIIRESIEMKMSGNRYTGASIVCK